MSKYNVYGIGNALVDMEFAVGDDFLKENNIDKGLMTLIDETRQNDLFNALQSYGGKKACGGSAAYTISQSLTLVASPTTPAKCLTMKLESFS